MRSARSACMFYLFLLAVPLWGQQAPSSQKQPMGKVSDLFHPARDPQAVSLANQALAAAGGVDAINAINDYTASGTMTQSGTQQTAPLPVTINGSGLSNLRIDTNMTKGVSAWAIYHGKASTLNVDGSVTPSYMRSPLSPSTLVFPHRLLASAVNSPFFSLFYEGMIEFNGKSVHDIRVQPTMPQGADPKGQVAALSAIDFLVDASTFQILATQDMVRTIRNMWVGHKHEIQYSSYQTTNGVSIPYSISESIGGQAPRVLQVTSISVNSGLSDTEFQLQATTH